MMNRYEWAVFCFMTLSAGYLLNQIIPVVPDLIRACLSTPVAMALALVVIAIYREHPVIRRKRKTE